MGQVNLAGLRGVVADACCALGTGEEENGGRGDSISFSMCITKL
jgi:hypothetical protein